MIIPTNLDILRIFTLQITRRIDYLMHPSPETSKKRAIEELSDSQDDHHPTTITRQRRGNRGNMVNQAKKLNSDKVHSYLE